jgi:hypothetical protein
MQSSQLIHALSTEGAHNLSVSLQWINPIPEDAVELVKKINIALSIVKFSQSRCEEEGGKSSTNHLDSLTDLKSEIDAILNQNNLGTL